MTKFLVDDESTRLVKKMKDITVSMWGVIWDLRGRVLTKDEETVLTRIESAAEELRAARCIFFACNAMDYDEWVKDNNAQTKKDET